MKEYNVVLKYAGKAYHSVESAGTPQEAVAAARASNKLPAEAKLVLVQEQAPGS